MFKTVYYLVKSELHYYPPCVAQIRMLNDAGVKVVAVYGSSKGTIVDVLNSEGIETVELVDKRGKYKGKWGQIYSWWTYRRAALKFLKGIDKEKSLIWFGNVESYLPLYGKLGKFKTAVTFLELLVLTSFKSRFVGRFVKNNVFLTACEETRAYIMFENWKLDKMPYVLPNKPYNIDIKKNALPSIPETKQILDKIGNSKFIVYQGILFSKEYMSAVAVALKEAFPDYYFVLMGLDYYNYVPSIKELNPNVIYIPYIPAPAHLEITSHAHIGLLFYEPLDLNRAFCAPNKIYEYTSFGLPIIGNNIPGLKNTVGTAQAAVCVDITKDNVINAVKYINSHYEQMQESAQKFFTSTDLPIITAQIIKENNIENNIEK